jgi:UDP-2,3-diacylglucosamine pyrophosphatase LpxH
MPSSTHIQTVANGTSPEDALRLEQERLQRLSENPPQEIFVVSDLHLGRGRNPETGRFSRTENFLSDQAFSRFLDYAAAGPGKLLFINGDAFDFVRICHYPRSDQDFKEWSEFLERLGVVKTPTELREAICKVKKRFNVEKRFGLETDDYKSAWKLLQIANGHREFFQALAKWISGGGTLLFSKGNHDLELYWPLVRKALKELLIRAGADAQAVSSQMFYCDDWVRIANVYFEHGHKYDPEQRVDDSDASPVLRDKPSQLKLPLGIFVNRYLINQLEKLEPFLGAVRPTEKILWMLLRTHPLSAIAILFRSLHFIRRAFQTSNVRDFFWYAVYLGSLTIPLLTVLAIAGIFAFARLRDFFVVKHPMSSMVLGALGMLAPYLAAAFRELVRWLGRKTQRSAQVGEDEMSQGVYASMEKLKFPAFSRMYAVMGHTHDQDIQRLPDLDGAITLYLNTGTWIPIWPDDRPDLAGQVLFPFVHFRREASQEYRHEYAEWRDDRAEPAESYILEPPVA